MNSILPIPTLDHVVINARDALDEAVALYQRLGFTLTPRGYHTLGSMNHLAIFGTHYLELLAVAPGPGARPDIMDHPAGLDGLVFGTEDSAATYQALAASGVAATPPVQFSRPVALPAGARDAVFRTVHVQAGHVQAGHVQAGPAEGLAPVGRIYFCHHFTRDLVWRDAWRRHANGAIGISRFVIAAEQPGRLAGLFARMFGADAMRALPAGGRRLLVELSSVDIMTPAAIAAEFGLVPESGGRAEFMAVLCLRTRALDQTARALKDGAVAGVRREENRIIVPPSETMGVSLVFQV